MEITNFVFGTYDDTAQASAAVDTFIASGLPPGAVTVLLREHAASIELAKMKGTRVPSGAEQGQKSDKPLEGSLGIMYPAEGPKRGVLDDALDGMGVPLDWPHGVLEGKALVSIETADPERATSLLAQTGASGISTAKSKAAAA